MSSTQARTLPMSYATVNEYWTPDANMTQKSTVLGVEIMFSTYATNYVYSHVNDKGKTLLFPNATAHPVKMDWQVSFALSIGILTSGTAHCKLRIGGSTIAEASQNKSNTDTRCGGMGLSSAAILAANKGSDISIGLYTTNKSLFAAAGDSDGIHATLTLYFTRYDFSASAGANVTSASVSSSTGYDGDTVTYSCTLASGAEFEGWYNGSTKVSSSQTHTHTVNGKDLALEARATMPVTTKTLSATYDGKQVSGFPKSTQSAVALSYGGTSKGSIPISGGTKTFKCGGKVTNSAIGIGSTTLNNSGKYMSTDVVVTVS